MRTQQGAKQELHFHSDHHSFEGIMPIRGSQPSLYKYIDFM